MKRTRLKCSMVVVIALVLALVGAQNLALDRPAERSSYYGGLGPENCVDGNYYSRHSGNVLCHTGNEKNPWFRVKLDGVHHVKMISVTNRSDCCQDRLKTSELLVGNSTTPTDNPVCENAVVDEGGFYDCDLWGEYVFVRRVTPKTTDSPYNLCEISVWGDRNIAPLGLASMQTTDGDNDATKAQTPAPISNDYARTAKYSMTLIDGGVDPWWQLDLGLPGIPIKYVLLTPRVTSGENECNPGIEVLVGDDATPGANSSCMGVFSNQNGMEVPCNLAGQFVTV